MSSSLLIFSSDNNAMISRYNTFYMNYPPGLKSFSLKCVVADLKVCILNAQTVEKFQLSTRVSTKSKGAHFLTIPTTSNIRKYQIASNLDHFKHFMVEMVK